NLLVAADDRVHLAAPRLLGQVDRVARERLALAHLRRRHRAARFTRLRAAAHREAVLRLELVLDRAAADLGEAVRQRVVLELLELARDGEKRVAQTAGLED